MSAGRNSYRDASGQSAPSHVRNMGNAIFNIWMTVDTTERIIFPCVSLPVYQSVLLPRLKAASKHLSWGQACVNPLLLGSFLPTLSCINFDKNNCRAHSFRTCSSEIFLYTFYCHRVCSWTFFQRYHTFKMGTVILKTHTVTLNIISINRNMHFAVWDSSEEPIPFKSQIQNWYMGVLLQRI